MEILNTIALVLGWVVLAGIGISLLFALWLGLMIIWLGITQN